MHDYFVTVFVTFFPGKVVVVFNAYQGALPQRCGDSIMDLVMTSGSIISREVHGLPVFDSFFRIERKPGKVTGEAGQLAYIHRELGIMAGDVGSKSART